MILAYVILAGIVIFAILRVARAARRDDNNIDGPDGPRRVRIRVEKDKRDER